mgnify:CR=1 FL=1
MTTREYLGQIQRCNKIINNKYIEIEQLKSHAMGLNSFSYGERVQTSHSHDKMGDLVAKIVDLQSEIQDITYEYIEIRSEVVRTIDSVKNPVLYDILFKKYILTNGSCQTGRDTYCIHLFSSCRLIYICSICTCLQRFCVFIITVFF